MKDYLYGIGLVAVFVGLFALAALLGRGPWFVAASLFGVTVLLMGRELTK